MIDNYTLIKANTSLFQIINKYIKHNNHNSSWDIISKKLKVVDDLLSIPNNDIHFELIYITHWSILNIFIECCAKTIPPICFNDKYFPNSLSFFDWTVWGNNIFEITKLPIRFNDTGNGNYFLKSSHTYFIYIKYYDGFKKQFDSTNSNKRKDIDEKDIHKFDFIFHLYFSYYNQDDIKYVQSKLNYLRNKLSITHSNTISINNIDCLLLIKFLIYLFSIPYNPPKFKLPQSIVQDNIFQLKGEITDIREKETLKNKPKEIIFEYTSNNKKGKLLATVYNGNYDLKVGPVHISFIIDTKTKMETKTEIIEKTQIGSTSMIESIYNNISVLELNNSIIGNNYDHPLKVSGKIMSKNIKPYDKGTYYYILIGYKINNTLKNIYIKIKCEEYFTLKVGDFIEASFYCFCNENSNRQYINNLTSVGKITVFKNDISVVDVINSFNNMTFINSQ